MNDLQELKNFGAALDPADPEPPARLRHRVLSAAAAPARRRRLPRLALAGGLAAAITAGVLAAQVIGIGGHTPPASAAASEILHSAAEEARQQPVFEVRPEQFVYVESIGTNTNYGSPTSKPKLEKVHRTAWLSAGGERDGLVRSNNETFMIDGCQNGRQTQSKGGKSETTSCTPIPAYLAGLPTTADAMLDYLYTHSSGGNPRDQQAFTTAADLIRESYVPPAALAAVFEAVARIPGVDVVGDVTDDAGRPGVAVALTEVQGMRTELIFDKKNHGFLGTRSVMVRDQDGLRKGDIWASSAVLKVAIVDRAGQTP
ncbi:CU044_5270 family protein [Dactylosporangium sp. CA-139066]|uniref:CU044_5270 family protein n=1 Tax=Dactylosporangium sp. CA-139066 TaxID=3239930 RepID=UPI003D8DF9B6